MLIRDLKRVLKLLPRLADVRVVRDGKMVSLKEEDITIQPDSIVLGDPGASGIDVQCLRKSEMSLGE